MSKAEVSAEQVNLILSMVLKSAGDPIVVLKSDIKYEEGKGVVMTETDDAFIFEYGEA